MGCDLMSILPEYFRPVLEFRHLMDTDSLELEELEQNIRRVRDNLFIQTCDSRTLGYYEGLLQLAGNRKLPVEARRNMILARYNTQPFYTFPVLKKMLSQAVGRGNYMVRCRHREYCLEVRVVNQEMALARSVYSMVFFVKPAHLVLLFYAEFREEAQQDVRSRVSGIHGISGGNCNRHQDCAAHQNGDWCRPGAGECPDSCGPYQGIPGSGTGRKDAGGGICGAGHPDGRYIRQQPECHGRCLEA